MPVKLLLLVVDIISIPVFVEFVCSISNSEFLFCNRLSLGGYHMSLDFCGPYRLFHILTCSVQIADEVSCIILMIDLISVHRAASLLPETQKLRIDLIVGAGSCSFRVSIIDP